MAAKMKIGMTGISFKAFWGFTPDQYAGRAAEMKKVAAKLGAGFISTPATFVDYQGAQAAAEAMNQADLCVLDVATYPEGKAAMTFFETIKVPLVLWSRDESVHGTHIGHNSFCGANFLAGNLALRGMKFRAIHGPLTNAQVAGKLRTAVKLIGAAKACAGARIGMFGEGIVPKFYDIDVAGKDRDLLKSRYGIEFVNIPIKDVVDRAKSYGAPAMAKAARKFAQQFSVVTLDGEAMDKQARLLQAFKDETAQGKFASIGIRCWPELQTMYEAWPCPSLSILNDSGLPTACEGDPGGALDMLLLSKLGKAATTLLDIVDWDDRKSTFAVWHCGPTACSWADKKTRLIPHDVDGRTDEGKPASGLPGVVDMDFAPGKVTLLRTLGALDDEFALQGQLVRDPSRHITGSIGIVAKATAYDQAMTNPQIREAILSRALPHHYTAAREHLFA
jgi:L-fucose isomerase-like protein